MRLIDRRADRGERVSVSRGQSNILHLLYHHSRFVCNVSCRYKLYIFDICIRKVTRMNTSLFFINTNHNTSLELNSNLNKLTVLAPFEHL